MLAGTTIDRLDAAGADIDKRALISSLVVFAANITAARPARTLPPGGDGAQLSGLSSRVTIHVGRRSL